MDPALIIFAIEAGVRLGRELNEVLVDETHERALVLPLGDFQANVREVIKCIPEHADRTAAGREAKVDGKTLTEAAKDSRDAIPEGHFLRQEIIAQGG